jgi:kynurenine 3-monooxygenase
VTPDFHVVGSGLAGTLMALYLAQNGYQTKLYERRQDMRKIELPAGRSINLALSARGLFALEEVGLKEKVLQQALPMRGRMMHDRTSKLTFQAYGQPHEHINSISRSYLNEVLLDAAEAAGVNIHFEQRCLGYDFKQGEALMESPQGAYALKDAPVIGADGAGSALRQSLTQQVRVNYHQDYLPHGYKEITIPAGADGQFQMEPEALHIWPRENFMLIALPNPDKTFTCTLFLAFEGDVSFEHLEHESAIAHFFKTYFPDVPGLAPDYLREFMHNPTGVLSTLRCDPWYVKDQLLLIGDASHAIVPFFGQGMNAAFEDCTLLNQALKDHGTTDLEATFKAFYSERKPNAEAIADMALDNFIEMRDTVADPTFLLHKKVALALEKRYPEQFASRYHMVSFQRVPYAQAQRQGVLQKELLSTLCQNIHSPEDVDWSLAESLLNRLSGATS